MFPFVLFSVSKELILSQHINLYQEVEGVPHSIDIGFLHIVPIIHKSCILLVKNNCMATLRRKNVETKSFPGMVYIQSSSCSYLVTNTDILNNKGASILFDEACKNKNLPSTEKSC